MLHSFGETYKPSGLSFRAYNFRFNSILFSLLLSNVVGIIASNVFDDNFYYTWTSGEPERWDDGNVVALKLTRRSGSGFASKNSFFHGYYSAKIKVPEGYSAGVIVAFYLMSAWDQQWTEEGVDRHDEIDFEFLGNTTSNGITLQTNWYGGGIGDHEERHNLWFDPAADYHEYSFKSNWEHIVWYVDGIPIREERADNPSGVFPSLPMFLMGSIWEASNWATQGGSVKIDWDQEPFFVAFKDFYMMGCYWRNLDTPKPPFCAKPDFIARWDEKLKPKESVMLEYIRRHYRYYLWHDDPWRMKYGIGLKNNTIKAARRTGKNNRARMSGVGDTNLATSRRLLAESDDFGLMDLDHLAGERLVAGKGIQGWPDWKGLENNELAVDESDVVEVRV